MAEDEQQAGPEQTAVPAQPPAEVSWTAPEFVGHAKSVAWYLGLAMGDAAAAIIIYLLTRDAVSVAVIIVAGLAFGIYGGRQPKHVQYSVRPGGISIGSKHFGYEEFKSFSVVPEGNLVSIIFMPLKRFRTIATIYFEPEYQEIILNVLTSALPYEEPRRDA